MLELHGLANGQQSCALLAATAKLIDVDPNVLSETITELPTTQYLLLVANLVDPASSHMLVSKIKPCMCLYRFLHIETANCSLIQFLIM